MGKRKWLYKYRVFCNVKFEELTKEELRKMRRECPRADLQEFLDFYKVDICTYCEMMRKYNFALSTEERSPCAEQKRALMPKPKPVEKIRLSRLELAAIRLLKGYTKKELAEKIGSSDFYIDSLEKGHLRIDQRTIDRYMQILKIRPSEIKHIRMLLNTPNSIHEERKLPDAIKWEVRKRYKNKCAKCDNNKKLHIHHIKRYADGGMHYIDNLILLCPACHAKEHEGKPAYHLLKSLADKLTREGILK